MYIIDRYLSVKVKHMDMDNIVSVTVLYVVAKF